MISNAELSSKQLAKAADDESRSFKKKTHALQSSAARFEAAPRPDEALSKELDAAVAQLHVAEPTADRVDSI